jgi:hypothetical protein
LKRLSNERSADAESVGETGKAHNANNVQVGETPLLALVAIYFDNFEVICDKLKP